MTYDLLLSDISKWAKEEFFYNERYFWWRGFSGFNGDDWIQKNLKKDEHKMPTSYIDVKTGKEVCEDSTFSFKSNLVRRLKEEFEKFERQLQRELILLEKESQRQQLFLLIDKQLTEIINDFQTQKIPEIYHLAILEVFITQQQKIQEKIKIDSERTASWKFEYIKKNSKNTKEDIGSLIADLADNKWIDSQLKNKQNLNLFLRKGKINDKVIWVGEKSILKALIEDLVKSNYFLVKNHWVAIEECFLVNTKSNIMVKAKGVRTTKRTTNKTAINLIKVIISNLKD